MLTEMCQTSNELRACIINHMYIRLPCNYSPMPHDYRGNVLLVSYFIAKTSGWFQTYFERRFWTETRKKNSNRHSMEPGPTPGSNLYLRLRKLWNIRNIFIHGYMFVSNVVPWLRPCSFTDCKKWTRAHTGLPLNKYGVRANQRQY